jgi:sugar fermentation stimulation protein A
MRLAGPLTAARFVARPNRFAIVAARDGVELYCHVANPGRMRELLLPGVELWLRETPGEGRKTQHEVVLVQANGGLACLDSRLPPALFIEAYQRGLVPELGAHCEMQREVAVGSSRLDLLAECDTGPWLVETKSCTLVEHGAGLFPDAPTLRGQRHLRELSEQARAGWKCAVAFVVQRSDAETVGPNDATDPDFGQALREAAASGVLLLALGCEVRVDAVEAVRRVPVVL